VRALPPTAAPQLRVALRQARGVTPILKVRVSDVDAAFARARE